MKRKTFTIVIALEILLSITILILQAKVPNWFTTMTAFPFEQIGMMLRVLSLSGVVGNILAILFYSAICLLPAAIYVYLRKKGKNRRADYFLPMISVVMFLVIYYMINPGFFVVRIPGSSKMFLGTLFYSVFSCYWVLRLIETCWKADKKWLEKGLYTTLYFVVMLLVFEIVVGCLGTIFKQIPNFSISYVFMVLQCLVKATPYALDIVIVFAGMKLLDTMKRDTYSDEAVVAVEKLANICTYSLVISMISGLVMNVMQVLSRNYLENVNLVITVPIFSIMLAFIVLLLAKYIRETQKVKQELDMFI